jgi:hypothetical protein
MAIASDTGGGTPFAKFRNVGDTLIGAHCAKPRECVRERRKYGTNEPVLKDDGTPAKEEILWLVAMPGTTAVTGDIEKDETTPIEPLELVRVAVAGYKWGQVIDARKDLPAVGGFKMGQTASGDVYEVTLVGWSAQTDNPTAAAKGGFTVVDGRIVLRTQDEKDAYVLTQSRKGGNTNPAKDFEVTIRRPGPADKAYEQEADRLYLEKVWAKVPASVGAAAADDQPDYTDEPF